MESKELMSLSARLNHFLKPPVFPEDEFKTRLAYYLSTIVKAILPVLLVFLFVRIGQGIGPLDISNLLLAAIGIVLIVSWLIMKAGAVHQAGYLSIGLIWLGSTFLAFTGSGLRGTGFVSYFVVIALAGLLLGARAASGIALLSTLSGFGLAYAESAGIVAFSPNPPFVAAFEFAFLFILSMVVIRLTINTLQGALENATANSRQLAISNVELSELRDVLELRIQERTASLEKRASQLQTVSSIARSVAAMKEIDTLLQDITRLVSSQLGFYHTGIFLLDDAGKYAVLKAANSEGGREMLHRGHELAIDSNSIVGHVAYRGEYRIALDVGADSVYFSNPLLPKTRSEMALPLRVSGRVIGVLDMQSTEVNVFSDEDIPVLYTLADQVAVAIENARLYESAQKALSESQATFERYVKQEWSSFAQKIKHPGFTFDGKQVTPLEKVINSEAAESVVQTGRLSTDRSSSTITIPVKLRGQTIGVLDVRSRTGNREWTSDEITLLEAAAERAALALENARLVDSAQRRASRERSIGEISAKIGAVSNFEAILQTAVEELGRKLSGAPEVTLELDREKI